MNTFKKIVLAACVAAAGFSTSASASFIGDTITADFTESATLPVSRTIGTGVEFSAVNGDLLIDFGANTLTLSTPFGSTSWGDLGPLLFAGFNDTITAVSFIRNGFGTDLSSDFSFTAHTFTLDFDSGSTNNRNSTLVFTFTTTPPVTTPPAAVPEPATTALLGLGLLGFAASRRKSAKSKNA